MTAQDYDGKPVQTPVHLDVKLEKWEPVQQFDYTTQKRSETDVTSKDAGTGADGTVLVDLPAISRQRRLRDCAASADTPEKRSVEGKTWVWIWNGAGDWYNQNTQAQIVADKKSYQVGDVAHLLLVTGLKDCVGRDDCRGK